MEFKYKIGNPSHEFLVDAFQNPPENPDRINLTFLANGIEIPFSPKDGELENYLKACHENNIIPFSNKTIKYNFHVEEYIPKHLEGMRRFFGDGRTNSVLIDINSHFNQEIFHLFNTVLFPSLLENNYKISEGYMSFSEHKVGDHYSEGYEPDLGIFLNRGRKGFGFLLDDYYIKNEEQIAKYEKWFEDLKTKYSVH